MNRKLKVTLSDVARKAGVGTATAGRVLGGYGYASDEKRAAVLAAAEALGYRPNSLAKSLITGRTMTIGVVTCGVDAPGFASILRGVGDVAEAEGLAVLVSNSDQDVGREIRQIELLLEKQVDGLVVAPCGVPDSEHLHAAAAGRPLVLVDRALAALPVDVVGIDTCGSAKACVTRLIAAGHRHIAILGDFDDPDGDMVDDFLDRGDLDTLEPIELHSSWQRLLGYLRAHRAAGLEVHRELVRSAGDGSPEAAHREAETLFLALPRPTALVSTDGSLSSGVVAAVAAAGIKVPHDLSLASFDDVDWMAYLEPTLDALAHPRTALGATAARMLIERMGGYEGPARRVELEATYVARGSVIDIDGAPNGSHHPAAGKALHEGGAPVPQTLQAPSS